jgi:hypothetical protein
LLFNIASSQSQFDIRNINLPIDESSIFTISAGDCNIKCGVVNITNPMTTTISQFLLVLGEGTNVFSTLDSVTTSQGFLISVNEISTVTCNFIEMVQRDIGNINPPLGVSNIGTLNLLGQSLSLNTTLPGILYQSSNSHKYSIEKYTKTGANPAISILGTSTLDMEGHTIDAINSVAVFVTDSASLSCYLESITSPSNALQILNAYGNINFQVGKAVTSSFTINAFSNAPSANRWIFGGVLESTGNTEVIVFTLTAVGDQPIIYLMPSVILTSNVVQSIFSNFTTDVFVGPTSSLLPASGNINFTITSVPIAPYFLP